MKEYEEFKVYIVIIDIFLMTDNEKMGLIKQENIEYFRNIYEDIEYIEINISSLEVSSNKLDEKNIIDFEYKNNKYKFYYYNDEYYNRYCKK